MPTIEVHVEGPVTVVMGDAETLARIERKINEIRRQGGTIMATQADFEAVLGRINAATSEIGSDLGEAIDRLRAIPEVPDEVVATLQQHADTLENIASAYPEASAGAGGATATEEVPGATPIDESGTTPDAGAETGDGSDGVPA